MTDRKIHSHLFICTHLRDSGESCAEKGSVGLRDEVKKACSRAVMGEKAARLRVNAAGCLGVCERGITAVLYPEGKWFLDLKATDAPLLIAELTQRSPRKGEG
jgi:(2Fe-2S) ferredoxin